MFWCRLYFVFNWSILCDSIVVCARIGPYSKKDSIITRCLVISNVVFATICVHTFLELSAVVPDVRLTVRERGRIFEVGTTTQTSGGRNRQQSLHLHLIKRRTHFACFFLFYFHLPCFRQVRSARGCNTIGAEMSRLQLTSPSGNVGLYEGN